jgi:hypothetical protein
MTEYRAEERHASLGRLPVVRVACVHDVVAPDTGPVRMTPLVLPQAVGWATVERNLGLPGLEVRHVAE